MCTERRRRQAGISLVELVIFIVVVSIGLVGLLAVMNVANRGSADPLVRKQALAIAESILEEVMLMPFTFCDPDDPAAADAAGASDCGPGMDQNNGGNPFTGPIPASETRYSSTAPFDNVADYAGFTMTSGIADSTGDGTAVIPGLQNYRLQPIGIQRIALGNITAGGNALLITVTVTDAGGANAVTLQGIRTRYAPRAMP
ncbi:MAG TPA: prepilin-type N-terminal cleavage/methylation domain-containing protein [Noviherbaspirillum sp.]|nr:prepilin-type N-terminal cleavage/methylation domain-containing protein [Noviherbaspirillum sp.]